MFNLCWLQAPQLFSICISAWRHSKMLLTLASLSICFLSLYRRIGIVHGTQQTPTWPSVSRTQCWCGSPASTCGCWPLSTVFTSTATTMDVSKCPASVLPKWWELSDLKWGRKVPCILSRWQAPNLQIESCRGIVFLLGYFVEFRTCLGNTG